MADKPKTRDNGAVSAFLGEFLTAGELIEAHPRTDDIITGVLEARTAGDTADCTLSRRVLFHVLQQCPAISVEHIAAVTVNPKTGGRYGESTLRKYAAAARVASRELTRFIAELPAEDTGQGEALAREEVDREFLGQLRTLALA